MNDSELLGWGYELCEFGGECEICNKEVVEGELFWRGSDPEYPREGSYYCRACASQGIQEILSFEVWFQIKTLIPT